MTINPPAQRDTPCPIECPKCAHVLATVSTARFDCAEPYIRDGDCIQKLPDEIEAVPGFVAYLEVGRCGHCDADYWGVASTRADVTRDVLYHDVECPIEEWMGAHAGNLIGEHSGRPWILMRDATPSGPIHRHQFGPFLASDLSGVVGESGVSACGRAQTGLWATAAAIVADAWPHMELAWTNEPLRAAG